MNRKSYFRMKVVNTIMGFFFKGLLVVVPIWVSGYVIYWIITTLNNAFSFVVGPGYGLLIVLAAITLIGMLVNYMVTDPISRFFNSFLDRMPVIKMMYTTIRDFLEAFVGEQKKFTAPVFVEMSETGIKKVGFITKKDLTALVIPGYVGVSFPHSYNFLGIFLAQKNVV